MGNHQAIQQHEAVNTVPVPDGLAPEQAVVARLMGVSMATLTTTRARPGDAVIVSGMGPVGYLAAHLFQAAGFEVHAVEPDEGRRQTARRSGLASVFAATPLDRPSLAGKTGLAVECSGHEQAILEGCRMVRRGGEVVLVGVPWKARTQLSLHELAHAIFHGYVTLRSGWEWELPLHPADFRPHSSFGNFRLALKWLAEGRIPVKDHLAVFRPAECQGVYQQLLKRQRPELFQVFDWRE